MILAVCIALSLYFSNQNVYALGESGTVRSYGNIVFESKNGMINLQGSDIAYLRDKLSSIPTDVYDPGYYTHLHEWDFENITESTHSRKCMVCGYEIEEECDFLSYSETGDDMGGAWYCECGNSISGNKDINIPTESESGPVDEKITG